MGEHVYYTAADFSPEELLRQNALAIVVVKKGRKICKKCGYEARKETPVSITCEEFRKYFIGTR